jgi:hypothetical protein
MNEIVYVNICFLTDIFLDVNSINIEHWDLI